MRKCWILRPGSKGHNANHSWGWSEALAWIRMRANTFHSRNTIDRCSSLEYLALLRDSDVLIILFA